MGRWTHFAQAGDRRERDRRLDCGERLLEPKGGLGYVGTSGGSRRKGQLGGCIGRVLWVSAGEGHGIGPGPGELGGNAEQRFLWRRLFRAGRVHGEGVPKRIGSADFKQCGKFFEELTL